MFIKNTGWGAVGRGGARWGAVGHGGLVVGALALRSDGRWFEAQSLPLSCFLRQETSPHIVSLHPGV